MEQLYQTSHVEDVTQVLVRLAKTQQTRCGLSTDSTAAQTRTKRHLQGTRHKCVERELYAYKVEKNA